MNWIERLDVGMRVYATDGLLGTIASVPRVDMNDPTSPAEVIVLVTGEGSTPGAEEFRRFTREMVDRVENDAVYLNQTRSAVPRASETVAATLRGLAESQSSLRIPLIEEELDVERRVVELGNVTVQKKVDELLDERKIQLRHQEVEVEHVPVDKVIDQIIEPYMEGDVFVIPVIEEEVIVTRQLRLKEEVRLRRVVGQHEETVRTPYRKERVVVSEEWNDEINRSRVGSESPTVPHSVERSPTAEDSQT